MNKEEIQAIRERYIVKTENVTLVNQDVLNLCDALEQAQSNTIWILDQYNIWYKKAIDYREENRKILQTIARISEQNKSLNQELEALLGGIHQ